MIKKYDIEVDCAACAAKMEEVARKIEGVKNVTINFMFLKMTVEFAQGADEESVMKAIRKACRRIESSCEVMI